MTDTSPVIAAPPSDAPVVRRRRWRTFAAWLGKALLIALILAIIGWSTLAVLYSDLSIHPPRKFLAALVLIASLAALIFIKPRKWGVLTVAALFTIVLIWFLSLTPTNDRDWAPEYQRLATATLDRDRLTVHNVRDFDYRSETDFTPRWYDHTYDLSKLKGVDYILSYWGPTAIAHGMVSFEFENDHPLAISVETRREANETYSAVQGFFRQYELIYVFADERDVLRLRTNFRNEDVRLYHTALVGEHARAFLLDYVTRANQLATHPDFYNAGTSNCSTNILTHLKHISPTARFSISVLLNGHSAQAAHANGGLDQTMTWDALNEMSRIGPAALAAGNDPDFSRLIRANMPKLSQPTTVESTAPMR